MDNLPKLGTSLLVGADGASGSIIAEEFENFNIGTVIHPPINDLDYRNKTQIQFFLERHQPDNIFFIGAYTNVDRAEKEDKTLCWEINRGGIEHFLETMVTLQKDRIYKKCPKIVYISTDMVGTGEKPLREDETQLEPKNEYGKSKLAGEKILSQYSQNRECGSMCTVRIATPFAGLRRGSFLTLLNNTIRNGEKINLIIDQFVTPTYVEDLAWNLVLITKYGDESLYHDAPVSTERLSVYDVGMEFARICGWDVRLIEKMTFETMYKKGWWMAPRGKSDELEVKHLFELKSPIAPRVHNISQVLENFARKYFGK